MKMKKKKIILDTLINENTEKNGNLNNLNNENKRNFTKTENIIKIKIEKTDSKI